MAVCLHAKVREFGLGLELNAGPVLMHITAEYAYAACGAV